MDEESIFAFLSFLPELLICFIHLFIFDRKCFLMSQGIEPKAALIKQLAVQHLLVPKSEITLYPILFSDHHPSLTSFIPGKT